MEYTLEEIEILKRVVKDYEELEKEIDKRIRKGATIDNLLDYIRHLSACDITNCELKSEISYIDYEYIDFNYCDMTCSIIQNEKDNIPLHLSNCVEVWNDKEGYLMLETETIENIRKIIKERG